MRPVANVDRRPPGVSLTATPTGLRIARVVITVRWGQSEQQPPQRPRPPIVSQRRSREDLARRAWNRCSRDASEFSADVPLVAGSNRLVAHAFNGDNIKSPDAMTTVDGRDQPRPSAVHILAVGIDRYANAAFNLRYAGADAITFASELERRQRALGTTQVNVTTLLDDEATRENIMFGLARLSGAPAAAPVNLPAALASLTRANPEDTVVIYFAGHGLGIADRFHLIPTDLRYTGSRDAVTSALPAILANAISDRDLEQVLEPLDARHILLVIDACDSGQALEATEPRFGPMNSRGLAQLAVRERDGNSDRITGIPGGAGGDRASAWLPDLCARRGGAETLRRRHVPEGRASQVNRVGGIRGGPGAAAATRSHEPVAGQRAGPEIRRRSACARLGGCRRRVCSGAVTTRNAPSSSPAPDRQGSAHVLEVAGCQRHGPHGEALCHPAAAPLRDAGARQSATAPELMTQGGGPA